MDREQQFLENRILELANLSYSRGIYTYSNFLNLNEQNIINDLISKLPPIDFSLVGGNIYAERKIAVFKPNDIYYKEEVPISIIKIEPTNLKFSEILTHRDFLGAILNLGIDRNKIGDILVTPQCAYAYVLLSMSDYIMQNLLKVKHTMIKCSIATIKELKIMPEFKELTSTINNIRLDAVISLAFGVSRSSIVNCISEGKVFINGKLTTSNGHPIKEGDIISVRGMGRCIFDKQLSVTKKGRNLVRILKYV